MIPTTTLYRFILAEQRRHPDTTGELSDLLLSISLGVKFIHSLLTGAGVRGLHGYTGRTNVQGEQVHEIDEQADQTLVSILGSSGHFGLLLSEEHDSVMAAEEGHQDAKYVVAFDPLDGSSNLDSCIPVGTIFGIFRKKDLSRPADRTDFLQTGRNLVAAGYAVYGPTTRFVYSSGRGVHCFALDPLLGEFVLVDEQLRTPSTGKIYSVNEGNSSRWSQEVTRYVQSLKENAGYSLRYAGSLVADFDRNLRRGGVFLYPGDEKHRRGKLRLIYECMPLAFIAEQAGGRAIDGEQDILDILPSDVHERCPLVIGSTDEVERYLSLREASGV